MITAVRERTFRWREGVVYRWGYLEVGYGVLYNVKVEFESHTLAITGLHDQPLFILSPKSIYILLQVIIITTTSIPATRLCCLIERTIIIEHRAAISNVGFT